jgi:7-dehydrocholesterol reductase
VLILGDCNTQVNGLLAWFLTHALFVGMTFGGLFWFRASIIHDHWGALLIAANVYGYSLTVFAYAKAYLFPSHAEDCKFSGAISFRGKMP